MNKLDFTTPEDQLGEEDAEIFEYEWRSEGAAIKDLLLDLDAERNAR